MCILIWSLDSAYCSFGDENHVGSKRMIMSCAQLHYLCYPILCNRKQEKEMYHVVLYFIHKSCLKSMQELRDLTLKYAFPKMPQNPKNFSLLKLSLKPPTIQIEIANFGRTGNQFFIPMKFWNIKIFYIGLGMLFNCTKIFIFKQL